MPPRILLVDVVHEADRSGLLTRPAAALLRIGAFAACAAFGGRAAVAQTSRALSAPPPLHVTRLTLPNGLIALLNEDHSTPVVAINLQYHFGSADEAPNQVGYAHMCEHMMGEGSRNEPQPREVFLQSRGALSAHWAETAENRTQYYSTIPSNQLETALWVEADAMAVPFARVDSTNFAAVRDVVRQERLQSRESPPYGLVQSAVIDAFYQTDRPYPRDMLGPMNDLDRASIAGLRAFCLPYYVPNNAVLSLSGDFRTADAERLVRRYFGAIPRRAAPPHPAASPLTLTGADRLALEDAHVRAPHLFMAWPSVGFAHPDKQAVNLVATLLGPAVTPGMSAPGAERTARLSKLLIYDLHLATSVRAENFDLEQGGVFQIDVTPRSGVPLGAIEHVVDSVVADVATAPVTPLEMARYKNFTLVAGTTSLQTRGARADTLAEDELYAHDPLAYVVQMKRALGVTEGDVHRVAREYLGAGHVVLSVVPAGKLDLVSDPDRPYKKVGTTMSKPVP
jgi:zinc protease